MANRPLQIIFMYILKICLIAKCTVVWTQFFVRLTVKLKNNVYESFWRIIFLQWRNFHDEKQKYHYDVLSNVLILIKLTGRMLSSSWQIWRTTRCSQMTWSARSCWWRPWSTTCCLSGGRCSRAHAQSPGSPPWGRSTPWGAWTPPKVTMSQRLVNLRVLFQYRQRIRAVAAVRS